MTRVARSASSVAACWTPATVSEWMVAMAVLLMLATLIETLTPTAAADSELLSAPRL